MWCELQNVLHASAVLWMLNIIFFLTTKRSVWLEKISRRRYNIPVAPTILYFFTKKFVSVQKRCTVGNFVMITNHKEETMFSNQPPPPPPQTALNSSFMNPCVL